MKISEIRTKFLDYFADQGHQVVPSSPLVPGNDPTLLFTNAGMVQFKETFLGQEPRSYQRATSSQRCVRAGGKHNDLENVGYTARHHTFFEMLGNFSFGDYFKREAINYAWQFLTVELGLPADKLWVSVYKDDKEAEAIWFDEVGIDKNRFSRCGEKDNFWSMGDTGPCGPCTEIFYDHGSDIAGGPPGSPDEDGDRYIEIWNLVFMQYNRQTDGSLLPLPKPSVDTGMGLERIAAVVQGVHTNYEIDLFQHLLKAIYALAPKQEKSNASFNVIADHIRASAFLIIDGIIPGNEGRAYVLRRIIRRAARHGHKLGLNEPFFYRLLKPLAEIMGDAYPELIKLGAHIEKVLLQEEEQFARTLEHGMRVLDADINALSGRVISGQTVFKLYDTYGFPYDLTADIARERQLTIDDAGFDAAMAAQRSQSQAKQSFAIDYSALPSLEVSSEFCGYDTLRCESQVLSLLKDNALVSELVEGDSGAIVLGTTPFYAESGGQVGDKGVLLNNGARFEVKDTQAVGDAIVHYGLMLSGQLAKEQTVQAQVDESSRRATMANHSATHLLHAALKQVLGAHVQQKGSLVNDTRSRFDFSHYQGLSEQELMAIETLVNQQVQNNYLVTTELMSPDAAKAAGAMALFGEKYGESVRVLTMGEFSKELCGGTHVARTGDIGFCKLVSEGGIASGVRRIEMLTGLSAVNYVQSQDEVLSKLAFLFKGERTQLLPKAEQLLEQNKQLEKSLAQVKAQQAQASASGLVSKAVDINGVKVLAVRLDNAEPKSLRTTLDKLKSSLDKAVVVLAAVNGSKMNVIAGVTKSALEHQLSAKKLVQLVCGKGGGRDDMAQGGGLLVDDLDERLAQVMKQVSEVMNG